MDTSVETYRLSVECVAVPPADGTVTADAPPFEVMADAPPPVAATAADEADSRRGLRGALGSLARLPRLLSFSAGYALAYGAARVGRTTAERSQLKGRLLCDYLIRMGPLYIKLGQVLATRADLVPEQIIAHLSRLHDDCPPSSEAYVRQTLARLYGRPATEVFAAFDFTPLASGSIAQVHRARLKTGQDVAVKIVKKGVREQLSNDLRLCGFLLRAGAVLPGPVREHNLAGYFVEIRRLLTSQADMEREASDQEEMYACLAGHPYIVVPKPYRELSGHDVLVMDFIEGIKGHEAHKVGIEPSRLAERLQHAVYTMLFMNGIFHADPHPGNIFFTEDGKIMLVDFGLVGRIGEDEKWGLSSFFFACIRKEWTLAVERFISSFTEGAGHLGERRADFIAEFGEMLREHFENRKERWSTLRFVYHGRETLRKYGMRYTSRFTQVAFMFLTGEGFISQVDPQLDLWENARVFTDRLSPYLSAALKQRFDAELTERTPVTGELRARAARTLVAPTHLDRYFIPSRYPLFVREASGCRLVDVDGNSYIDLSCGYGPHILGYAHPIITEAIQRAAASGIVNALGQEAEVALMERLVEALPGAEKGVFSNSGTEAVIQAVRLCRAARGRGWVAKFEGHYHGFSDQGLVSSWFRYSGPESSPVSVAPPGVHSRVIQETLVLPYGRVESFDLIAEHADKLACVICEPLPAALADYKEEFLRGLRRKCDEVGVPLVFDEVVSGFRVAFGGVQTRIGVTPDLTCLGKIIGGGLPCGAVVGKRELVEIAKTSGDPFIDYESKTFIGGTMSGNSLSCAAGYAMISYLGEHRDVYDDLERKTEWLLTRFRRIAEKHRVQFLIKGRCSIFSMTFAYRAARNAREQAISYYKANLALAYLMRKRGVYIPELHTMMLSAAHTDEDLEAVAEAFDSSLDEMVREGFFVF
jgi:glutamate-1-semialdehyde 2,1-aminomutase